MIKKIDGFLEWVMVFLFFVSLITMLCFASYSFYQQIKINELTQDRIYFDKNYTNNCDMYEKKGKYRDNRANH